MKIYLDSSAFAKRFIEEMGSDEVEDICAQATELGLSVITVPEIMSALNRRLRERTINPQQYNEAKKCLMDEVRDVYIINLTVSVIGSSVKIIESSPSRAMDAIHIACAIEWGAELFVSADKQQLTASKKVGLKTKQV